MKINMNLISMFVGAGFTGAGLRFYTMFPMTETLLISIMGISIWVMAAITYLDKKKESKSPITKT